MTGDNPVSRANPALVEVKLRALARVTTGSDLTFVDTGVGAGMCGDVGFYLADDEPRAVGRALHWAAARALTRVEILASCGAADLARRARLIAAGPGPSIGVWDVRGAVASAATPVPAHEPPVLPAHHWTLAGLISDAGARPVDDHGWLVAEVAGLEVARVVDLPAEAGPQPAATIEVGVGQADRELSALIHTDDDPSTGLRRVVASVVQHRNSHSHHPFTRLARERWLRSIVLDRPGLVDAVELAPLVPLRARRGLNRTEPSAAGGRLSSGRPVMVLAMVGVDPDLIPEAADYRQCWNPEALVVLALPPRDLALSTRLLDRLPDASAVALAPPWNH